MVLFLLFYMFYFYFFHLYLFISILIDLMMILGTMTLTISVNNVIVLINFLSILFIIGYELLGMNCVEITLLIVIIYSSGFLCLFLMNGFMFIYSMYAINLLIIYSMYIFNLTNLFIYSFISINSYFDNLFVCFPCFWSVFLLEIAWNSFGNLVFDNDLLMLTVLLFWGISFNLKSIY